MNIQVTQAHIDRANRLKRNYLNGRNMNYSIRLMCPAALACKEHFNEEILAGYDYIFFKFKNKMKILEGKEQITNFTLLRKVTPYTLVLENETV